MLKCGTSNSASAARNDVINFTLIFLYRYTCKSFLMAPLDECSNLGKTNLNKMMGTLILQLRWSAELSYGLSN